MKNLENFHDHRCNCDIDKSVWRLTFVVTFTCIWTVWKIIQLDWLKKAIMTILSISNSLLNRQGKENLTETNVAKTLLAVVCWADDVHFYQQQIENCWKHFWKWHCVWKLYFLEFPLLFTLILNSFSPLQSLLTNSNNASIRKAPLQTYRRYLIEY